MTIYSLFRVIPSVVVFVGLAGLAYWGHSTGWKMPGFLSSNKAAAKPKEDWCEPHSVPESICIECNEALVARVESAGWCETHGVPECPWCDPAMAQRIGMYKVTDEDRERAKRALAFERRENSEFCTLHHRRIQFESIAAAQKGGIEDSQVTRKRIVESIPVSGEVAHDPGRVAHLASRSSGTIAKVYKHLGQEVVEGEVLALIDAGEVGRSKTEYVQASLQFDVKQKARERLSSASAQAVLDAADASVREAFVRFQAARQALINLALPRSDEEFQLLDARGVAEAELNARLYFLGIPEPHRRELDRNRHSNNLLPLRAPMGGIILSRDMVPGEVVDPSRPVVEIVDRSAMWILLDVRAEDEAKIILNQTQVAFIADGRKEPVKGPITWLSPVADEKTRTFKVRVEVANPGGKLRAKTFGSGKILLREEEKALVVPSSSVHWEGDCHVVFVRDKNWFKEGSYKFYHTRVVRIGVRDEKATEIIAGLLPDEVVATQGSEILRAELLRGNFGEGCACCGGHGKK